VGSRRPRIAAQSAGTGIAAGFDEDIDRGVLVVVVVVVALVTATDGSTWVRTG
jgi:hypothetical protein